MDIELIKTLKLGKKEARYDSRTLKLRKYVTSLPPVPVPFDVDSQYPNLTDKNVFLNDTYGDCVIAGRAHQTLRFENHEQKTVIPITDDDVKTEYFKESGGADSGLDMITSLNAWRKGWPAAGQNYNIFAYAEVDPTNKNEIMATIYLLNGVYCGVRLPISAQAQTGTDKIWDVDNTANGQPGTWGGHCIYLKKYDKDTVTCITWGFEQKMTWAFLAKYSDQCFGVIDNKDSWVANDTLDVNALQNQLNEIIANPPEPVPTTPLSITTLALPTGTTGQAYTATLQATGGTPPYSWAIQVGTLPVGLAMGSDGVIAGIPTTATSASIFFGVTDAAKTGVVNSFILQIVDPAPPKPVVGCCKVGKVLARMMLRTKLVTFKKGV